VLGTPFDASYHPVKDKAGAVVGVTYIALYPDSGRAMFYLAMTYERNRDNASALKAYQRVLGFWPDMAEAKQASGLFLSTPTYQLSGRLKCSDASPNQKAKGHRTTNRLTTESPPEWSEVHRAESFQ